MFDEIPSQQQPYKKKEGNELKFLQCFEQFAKPLSQVFIDDIIRTAGKDFDNILDSYFNSEIWQLAILRIVITKVINDLINKFS